MNAAGHVITEWRDVDARIFSEQILAQYRPAVLKGLVSHWPAVRAALQSPAAISTYLRGYDNGIEIDALLMPPAEKGRIFYNEDMSGFNFARNRVPVSQVLEQLARYAQFADAPAVAAQSALIAECLPGFLTDNRMPLLPDSIAPRIWIGNRVVTPAHFDESANIACVVAGRRRFTLFPPEEIGNLYIGPLGFAPTGTPISMVSFREPDFERFPRFRDALSAALVAELEPGDALYIPPLWWHHVESLDGFNALVNYWWKGPPGSDAQIPSALDCLLHCLLNLNHVPPEQRAAWRAIFDHYVFSADGESSAHIPDNKRGVLGPISPEMASQVRAFLANQLRR